MDEREQRRRQRRLFRSLAYISDLGAEEHLPMLTWVVPGNEDTLYGFPSSDCAADERDKVFRAWRDALEEEFHPYGEHTVDQGTWQTRLHGDLVYIVVRNMQAGV
ncbi:hypothetical protein FB384_004878 [Prauserella sediminis]|uniref:Uncharacterized protein n=1 Tax=Prauserella sediminis TaxID=577680 RepID=A0A839XV43_9PSEU|nr:hypothetical protein [Prauserella sediminis]MBB3665919.1 hypothetical protein [Prauserella sediminis]